MNTQEIIKEIRKTGKVGITMQGTEIEVLVDKSDLYEMIQTNDHDGASYEIYERAGLGYRIVVFTGNW
jgi:hypothetical protein